MLRVFKSIYFKLNMVAVCSAILISTGFGIVQARADDQVKVYIDRAKILTIDEPASTVIIGNPLIADATMPDNQTIVLTGRGFGLTNMVVMNDQREIIADLLVYVTSTQSRTVSVFSPEGRLSYSCSPNCERIIRPGDIFSGDPGYANTLNALQTRDELAGASRGQAASSTPNFSGVSSQQE